MLNKTSSQVQQLVLFNFPIEERIINPYVDGLFNCPGDSM